MARRRLRQRRVYRGAYRLLCPGTVTAVDPSDDQLAYARTRHGVKTVDFRVGDAQKLPFGDGSFDVAIMALVISFLRTQTKRPQKWHAWCGLAGGSRPTWGHSRRGRASRPHLRNNGINGEDFGASTQSYGFTAGSHARVVGKRRA